jgi:hypothetical protein
MPSSPIAPRTFRLLALALACASPLLHGCASGGDVHWSRVTQRDQHGFMPGMVLDNRPAAIFFAGPTGAVINLGGVPAARLVLQDVPVLQARAENTAVRTAARETPARP